MSARPLCPGPPSAVARAAARGLRCVYVTNNASRPPEKVGAHLRELGIAADDGDIVTSAQLAAGILAERLPAGAAVLVVGGEGLHQALAAEGLRGVGSMDDAPQAVVQGFGPDLGWRDLAEGARAVRAGLFWVASNLDLTVPTPHGPAPGNGALVNAVAAPAGGVLTRWPGSRRRGRSGTPLFARGAHGPSRSGTVSTRTSRALARRGCLGCSS